MPLRIGLLTATALLLAGPATAQRATTTAITCGQAQGFIQARGAAVVGTGGPTFDRYVRDRSFCEATEVTKTSFVPTRDSARCFIGYRCIEPSKDDWLGDR